MLWPIHYYCTFAIASAEKTAFAEMERLREQLPSGSVVAGLQNYDTYGDKLGTQ